MNKTSRLFGLIIISLVTCVAGCASIPSQITQSPSKNARIGVVAFMPSPTFISIKSIEHDGSLSGCQHHISGFDFARSIENNTSTALRQKTKSHIITLHYNHKTDRNTFIKTAISENHLDYLITFYPGKYIDSHRHYQIDLHGYGVFYENHVGWIKVYPIAKGFAKIHVNLLNQERYRIATSSIEASKELHKATWKSKCNQLNQEDITAFTSWIHQDVVPKINNETLKVLRLNE